MSAPSRHADVQKDEGCYICIVMRSVVCTYGTTGVHAVLMAASLLCNVTDAVPGRGVG